MRTGVVLVVMIKVMMNRISINQKISLDNSNLFVLIGTNRFSYFIANKEKVVLVCNTIELKPQDLNIVFESNADLQHHFSVVQIAFQNAYMTLVPNLIYKEEEAGTYLEKSFQIRQQHYLLTDNLLTFQCQNIYLAPIETYNFFLNRFSKVNYKHIATALLSKWQEEAVQWKNKSIFININESHFEIAAFNRDKLLIWNTYKFRTAEDVLYFVLLVFEQVELNVETAKVFLSGQVTEEATIHKLLFAYIRNIEFLKRTNTYQFDSNFEIQANHANFDLFSI